MKNKDFRMQENLPNLLFSDFAYEVHCLRKAPLNLLL